MAIKIYLGNVGSGKTASAVRDFFHSRDYRVTYSNIKTKLKNVKTINPSMIAVKEEDAKGKTKLRVNAEFWQEAVKKTDKGINVCIDEAHSVLNSRRSMSSGSIVITDWIALIRRVLGSNPSDQGDLILISQLHNRLDVIAREMANNIKYHVCYYDKICDKCGIRFTESSENPESINRCLACQNYKMTKTNFKIHVLCFANINDYLAWKEFGVKSHYNQYLINDIQKYFHLYNTLQWSNLFDGFDDL